MCSHTKVVIHSVIESTNIFWARGLGTAPRIMGRENDSDVDSAQGSWIPSSMLPFCLQFQFWTYTVSIWHSSNWMKCWKSNSLFTSIPLGFWFRHWSNSLFLCFCHWGGKASKFDFIFTFHFFFMMHCRQLQLYRPGGNSGFWRRMEYLPPSHKHWQNFELHLKKFVVNSSMLFWWKR